MMGAIANSNMGMPNPRENAAQGAGGQQSMPQPEVNQTREMSGIQEVREQRIQAIEEANQSMQQEPATDKVMKDSDPTGAMGSNIDVMA